MNYFEFGMFKWLEWFRLIVSWEPRTNNIQCGCVLLGREVWLSAKWQILDACFCTWTCPIQLFGWPVFLSKTLATWFLEMCKSFPDHISDMIASLGGVSAFIIFLFIMFDHVCMRAMATFVIWKNLTLHLFIWIHVPKWNWFWPPSRPNIRVPGYCEILQQRV